MNFPFGGAGAAFGENHVGNVLPDATVDATDWSGGASLHTNINDESDTGFTSSSSSFTQCSGGDDVYDFEVDIAEPVSPSPSRGEVTKVRVRARAIEDSGTGNCDLVWQLRNGATVRASGFAGSIGSSFAWHEITLSQAVKDVVDWTDASVFVEATLCVDDSGAGDEIHSDVSQVEVDFA